MTEPCAVYDLIVDDVVWYVGSTTQPKQRLQYHKARGKAPRAAVLRVVAWYPDVQSARSAEKSRICELKPRGNNVPGRPPMNNKPTIVRLPPDVLDRVDALAGNRRRADYIRKAVIKQVEADERTLSRRERARKDR